VGDLAFYNTLTQAVEPFTPIHPGRVNMYVCGVTVYDDCHLGHARSQIVFDSLNRLLAAHGLDVHYVRNITDIDDKIINKARETGRTIGEITSIYIDSFHNDMARLGVIPPTSEPRATQYLDRMISLIETMLLKGIAYKKAGDVYFRVRNYSPYGELSHQKIDELLAGARIQADEGKEDPLDFALWKAAKPNEPSYEAPFGPGRPGWHIECSAMALTELGETLDIHGGGMDLMFPHHENERAQSESVTGKTFVRTWIHNGFVTIHDEKMSKSLGNIFRIRTFFETSPFPEEVTREWLRYFLLSTHYRSPVDISDETLSHAKNALDSLYLYLNLLNGNPELSNHALDDGKGAKEFLAALSRDLDTPVALRILHEQKNRLNPALSRGDAVPEADRADALVTIRYARNILGVLTVPPDRWVYGKGAGRDGTETLPPETLESLVLEREKARRERNFEKADQIRDRLKKAGFLLEDNPGGLPRIRRI
jgi:cysteinyl-tRNA synthetase